jgi:hypothetical protein
MRAAGGLAVLNLTIRDGFANESEVTAALAAWPAAGWHEYGPHKRVSVPGAELPGPIALLLHRMAAMDVDGIPDLGLWAAGLHEMPAGSPGLGWHADAERHPHLGFERARSGVLWLCGDGDLEFKEGARVEPVAGRLVLFDGSAAHRVGPVATLRRSVTLFWYRQPVAVGTVRAVFEAGK